MRLRRNGETVHRITGAAPSITEDVNRRTSRYLFWMGVRTVCFVLAVVVSGPLRWVFIAMAILLPYVSVVFANAGRESAVATPDMVGDDPRPQLPAGRG